MTLAQLFELAGGDDTTNLSHCSDKSQALVYMDVNSQEYREAAHKLRTKSKRNSR